MDKINAILDTLIKSEVPEQISGRIDATFESFILKYTVKSHQDFNRCLADFIQYFYKNGLLQAKSLCHKTALGEAIDLLELYYDSQDAIGYDAAYLDAVGNSGKGIGFVLQKIAEIIKTREIAQWQNSVFLSTIDPLDKNRHLEIVEVIIGKYGALFPDEIRSEKPVCFIDLYRELIIIIVSSEKQIRQIASPSR